MKKMTEGRMTKPKGPLLPNTWSVQLVLEEILKKEKEMVDIQTGGKVMAIKSKHLKRVLHFRTLD